MIALLMPLLSRFGVYIAGGLAILAVLAYLYTSIKSEGRHEAETANLRSSVEAVQERRKEELNVRSLPSVAVDDGLRQFYRD